MQVGLTRNELLGLIAEKAKSLYESISCGSFPLCDNDIDVAVSRMAALTAHLFESEAVSPTKATL